MAKDDTQHTQNYLDGVFVKISERYKPPMRITMPSCCSNQRASHEQELLASLHYDFHLEQNVNTAMGELRAARQRQLDERKCRLNIYNENRNWSRDIREKTSLSTQSMSKSTTNTTTTTSTLPTCYYNVAEHYAPRSTTCGSNVLTPMPIASSQMSDIKTPLAKPRMTINLSDFETEASPFDSVELKTLNDYEELAQVLQPNSYNNHVTTTTASVNNNIDNVTTKITRPINGVYAVGPHTYHTSQVSQVSHHVPVNPIAAINPDQYNFNDNYTQFLYNNPIQKLELASQYQNLHYDHHIHNVDTSVVSTPVNYNHVTAPVTVIAQSNTMNDEIKSKSVPDIMHALRKDLDEFRVHNNDVGGRVGVNVNQNSRVQSTGGKFVKHSSRNSLASDKSYEELDEKLKSLAKQVSAMGFPLDRVSRACKLIGDSEEKLVLHMIALSELLDLGFQEEKVSEALLKFDNNRDNALEYLIS